MSDEWFFGHKGRLLGLLAMSVLAGSINDRLDALGWFGPAFPLHDRVRIATYVWAAILGVLCTPPAAMFAVIKGMLFGMMVMIGVGAIETTASYINHNTLRSGFVYAQWAYIASAAALTFWNLPKLNVVHTSTSDKTISDKLAQYSPLTLAGELCSILGLAAVLWPEYFDRVHMLLKGM